MKSILGTCLFLSSLSASAACYTPFGEISAVQVNEAEARGIASLYLTRTGSTTLHNGALYGKVTALTSGFPSKIAYSVAGPTASLKLTGSPDLTSLVWLDAQTYSLRIPVKINSGHLNGKPATGSFVVRGTANVVTFEEKYYIISGSVCY